MACGNRGQKAGHPAGGARRAAFPLLPAEAHAPEWLFPQEKSTFQDAVKDNMNGKTSSDITLEG
jgi:hypothetical protein